MINFANFADFCGKKLQCTFCDYTCSNQYNFKKHLSTRKCIKMRESCEKVARATEEDIFENKINICHDNNEFYCILCKYRGKDKYDYKRHCKSKKHNNNLESIEILQLKKQVIHYEVKEKEEQLKLKDEIIKVKEDMLMLCINQNKEFQIFMMEQMKVIQEKQLLEQTTNNNIAMNNCNNKTFNLQFFLNETCKDAMNLSDFVNNIKIEVDDLIDSPIGYVKCITSQFMKFYKQLPVEKRPFHCSDEKRRSLHVKENGEWAIDECEAKIRKAVKSISHKNICRLVSWKKLHLDYCDPESVTNTQYISIIQNCCAGKDDLEIEKNEMKVVFNLIKESVIDKKRYIHSL
jgi:hypothetical protein